MSGLHHRLRAASADLRFVGGTTASEGAVTTESYTVSLTSLTGGLGTQPQEGDLVVICSGWGGTTNSAYQIYDATWTLLTNLYANNTRDANMAVIYKVMSATPDTSFTADSIPNASRGKVTSVHVWRGVNTAAPLDVTTTTATGINNGIPDSPSIQPVTAGSVILSLGLGTFNGTTNVALSGPSGMTNVFTTARAGNTDGSNCGIASYAWSSGAYNPPVWGGGASANTDSWAAATIAIRPA